MNAIEEAGQRYVVKSNRLNEFRVNLTLYEQKIILYLVSMIDSVNDKVLTSKTIKIKDFMKLVDVEDKGTYKRLRQITSQLRSKTFEIKNDKDDSILQTGWISEADYKFKKGEIEIFFPKKIAPYLLDLKKFFTQYKLKNILFLKSVYSIRIYEFLRQNIRDDKEESGFRISLEELKWKLCIEDDKYKRYNDFKKDILIRAFIEVAVKTDINFEFDEIKTGRKITDIWFDVKKGKQNVSDEEFKLKLTNKYKIAESKVNQLLKSYGEVVEKTPLRNKNKFPKKEVEQIVPEEQIDDNKVLNLLVGFGIPINQARKIFNQYGEEFILNNIKTMNQKIENGYEVKNKASFLVSSLKDDYSFKSPEQEKKDSKDSFNKTLSKKIEMWEQYRFYKLNRKDLEKLQIEIADMYKEKRPDLYKTWMDKDLDFHMR